MKITVFGAGSVGLNLAANLALAGANVTLAARGNSIAALQREELRITGALGEHHLPPGKIAVEDAAQAHSIEQCDGLIITTKTFEVSAALKTVLPHLSANAKKPWLLLLQNGWGVAEEAQKIVPADIKIFSGSIMTGLERRSATQVHVHVHVIPVQIGSLFGNAQSDVAPLLALLEKGYWPAAWQPDLARIMLTKLVFNCCLNPLGALIGCSYGELVENPDSRALLTRIADEAVKSINTARGMVLFKDGTDYVENDLIPLRMPKGAAHRSSMLQDIEAGRKTEIDYMNHAIGTMGRAHNIPTPMNDAVVQLIHAREWMSGKKS